MAADDELKWGTQSKQQWRAETGGISLGWVLAQAGSGGACRALEARGGGRGTGDGSDHPAPGGPGTSTQVFLHCCSLQWTNQCQCAHASVVIGDPVHSVHSALLLLQHSIQLDRPSLSLSNSQQHSVSLAV